MQQEFQFYNEEYLQEASQVLRDLLEENGITELPYPPRDIVEKCLYLDLQWEKLIDGVKDNEKLGWSQRGAMLCVFNDNFRIGSLDAMQWSYQRQAFIISKHQHPHITFL